MIFNVNSYNLKIMTIMDGNIEPIYFLLTAIAFIFLSIIQYKNAGKSLETIYLSILSIFFLLSYFALIWNN